MPRTSHDLFTIILHWLTALLVPFAYVVVQVMEDVPRGAFKNQLYGTHLTVGTLVLLVTIVRLGWKPFAPKVAPNDSPALMERAAKLVHWLLFLGLLAVPLLGLFSVWFRGRPLELFGLFSLPSPFAADRPLARNLTEAHELLANSLMILAVLHAAAALFHQYAMQDGLILRMLPGRRNKGTP